MLSKFCIMKRNFPKPRKKYIFNPNNNPVFISENFLLAYQRRKLKLNSLVNACHTRDGIVTIKINERSKAIKIHHMNDLLELFPNLILKINLSMLHLLMCQVNQCTELELAPLEFEF